MSVSDIRKTYQMGALNESDVLQDAIDQFKRWLEDALKSDILEPTAMMVATADKHGRPSARMLLLKGVDERGFIFFSNYQSRKAQELLENPQAALVFYWDSLERQVRVEGKVKKVSKEESESYFHSRPHGSQLGAWASQQSTVIKNRDVVEEKIKELSEMYSEGAVPLPEFWGGYVLEPRVIEFWQGRPNRLHDRLRYTRFEQGWKIERLSP
jgi:pyridoxamine 5'-phosphate oxidase